MSRIGLNPINIPSGVEVNLKENNIVEVKGPKGQLTKQIDPDMELNLDGDVLTVARPSEKKKHKSIHGLSRTLIANMIIGVTEGYSKSLEIEGTGYRAQKQGKKLILNLGFSHPVEMEDPEGIEVEVSSDTSITIKGIDKQQVGNYAAVIRDYRIPEPYKGKGVKYVGEYVRRKVGKTG
ncbi:MAG TPA: 50S ribosomal protein L6 [Tissierellaceae bacterium]|nr:50S ribosomal protein L6 [Tissierellaceae bacterium]